MSNLTPEQRGIIKASGNRYRVKYAKSKSAATQTSDILTYTEAEVLAERLEGKGWKVVTVVPVGGPR